MKIKAVCELTGLTDRAVRHYIEEGLLAPSYTENYLGRRHFDFSDADIALLKDIATLRKFGFSIEEIRTMKGEPALILATVSALVERKRAFLGKEEVLLSHLAALPCEELSSLSALAAALSAPVSCAPLPREDEKRDFLKAALSVIGRVLKILLLFLPTYWFIEALAYDWNRYAYPLISWRFVLLTILFLLPSYMLFFWKRKKETEKQWKGIRRALLVLFAVFLPLNAFLPGCIITASGTNDIRDYRRLDKDCIANRDAFYQDLFPTWPHYFVNDPETHKTVYLDAKYHDYYFEGFDYTYDIYAEWPLQKEDFDAEVARVSALFAEQPHEVIEKERYRCLVLTRGGGTPFEPVSSSYTYYIFAYDEENLRVRYILCDSLENGEDQPYYLTLAW